MLLAGCDASFQFLLTHHRYQEAGDVLNQTSSVIEGYRGDKENLIRTFYLVIQVSHLLMAGQVRKSFDVNLADT